MSYTGTTLIARSGYSGMGGQDPDAARSYCGQRFGVQSADFQPCVNYYTSHDSGDYQSSTPSTSASSSSSDSGGGGILDSIGKLLGGAASGAVQATFGPKPQPFPYKSGTPSWLMPVAIVGIGVVAVMMLKRRSSAPAPVSNPGRRRRRRRRSRR